MAEGEGAQESFCALLWRATGGQVDSKGRPVLTTFTGTVQYFSDEDIEDDLDRPAPIRRFARGYCTRPYDCANCFHMQQELRFHPPEQVNWVCPTCLPDLCREMKARGIQLHLPGHFTEGICMYKACSRPTRMEVADGLPGIPSGQIVETPPGYSRILQLVIGPINS